MYCDTAKLYSEHKLRHIFMKYPNLIPLELKLRAWDILNEFRKKREFHFPLQYYTLSKQEQQLFVKFLKQLGKDPCSVFTESYGFIMVLGWKKEFDDKHLLETDKEQNIFKSKDVNLMEDKAKDMIFSTRFYDNAILVDNSGKILHSGIMLRNLDPLKMFAEMKIPYDHKSCHSRHMTAIAASWHLKDTTVFTLSEETNILRIYQDGRRIFSSNPKEN